jgi:transcriptional regulator NrdR family protein
LSDFEKQVLGRFVKRRKLCNNCRKTWHTSEIGWQCNTEN